MPTASVHRELVLPNPHGSREPSPASRATITLASPHASWLEIHHRADGTVRYLLGAEGSPELAHTHRCLAEVYEGVELGADAACPFREISRLDTRLLRAVPNGKHHYWPMRLLPDSDRAGLLLHALSARELLEHELLLQLLFRRVPFWEQGLLTPSYPRFVSEKVQGHDRGLLPILLRRRAEPVYHVEIRAAVRGPSDRHAEEALSSWLRSWTSVHGTLWWDLRPVAGRARPAFLAAFRAHDMTRFAARKGRRDLSAPELAQVLPVPWRESHPGLLYAGAPGAVAPLAPQTPPSGKAGRAVSARESGILVGSVGDEPVRLPLEWHHLALLGKTRSGKSTLALNLALQILAEQPEAHVVLLEPTGNLVRELVERLPRGIAEDTVAVDPAHAAFLEEAVEMATVPLNLLHIPNRHDLSAPEFERRAERIIGDLLQSIKNAWGEESIGGRAEFVLRAVLQGLLEIDGTNLVDAYSALSEKKVMERLERLASGTQLKSALRTLLPKLDYSITFSSLDKVGKVATNPLLRKALCQRYRPVSFDSLLQHRLLLLDLAKDSLGTEASTFLGAVFLTQLWSALQERGGHARGPIYLIVDEFHNFAIPAFADMLSEGARHGLHVVAITQFLSRIPDRVRSALVGNVDAWLFFPVGAEDAKEVWEIAQGSRFGWKPEHFVGGLGPHQTALATRYGLWKVDTYSAPRPSPHAQQTLEAVRAASRCYAQPEDSESSPLAFSPKQVVAFLGAFADGRGQTLRELSDALDWPRAHVRAALSLGLAAGDVAEGQSWKGVEYGLRARGVFHRDALAVARNESEEHSGLLADAAAYLLKQGVHVHITEQEGGYLRPDGEFSGRGRDYSLEVECSTLLKHQEQVARNLRKAIAEGRRCLVVVPDEEMARIFASVLKRETPELVLWRDVGLLWRDGVGRMVPYESGERKPWGFLPGGMDDESREDDLEEEGPDNVAEANLAAVEDPHAEDLVRVSAVGRRLLEAGEVEATSADFAELFQPNGSPSLSLRRFGMAMASLGVPCRRVVRDGVKVRVYDLRALNGRSVHGAGSTGDPSPPVRDASDSTGSALPSDVTNPPVDQNQQPTDRNGPTYEKGGTGIGP